MFAAGRGGNGRGARKHGADGASVELAVPVGTQVNDEDGELVADLARPGAHRRRRRRERGRGNARSRRRPGRRRGSRRSAAGEEATLELRLKLVADAALAGLPNAGKSSLLRRISNATPKVADYPFTTLAAGARHRRVAGRQPADRRRRPGLIEGASEGVGLGHEFLAHLERARLLVHVIDGSAGDADERFATIDRELALYGAGLEARPQVVVLNKADLGPSRRRSRSSTRGSSRCTASRARPGRASTS